MRSDKAEEEVAELMKKAEQLEVELDKTKEELVNNMILQLRWIMMMERSGLSAGDLFGIRMVCGVVKWWLQHDVVTSKVWLCTQVVTTQRLEDKEKGLQGAELEVASLNRCTQSWAKEQCFFWEKEET